MTAETTSILTLVLASGASTVLMGLLKKSSSWVAKQEAQTKQVLVVGISVLVVTINAKFGLTLSPDASSWTVEGLNSLLVALGAFGFHNLKTSLTSSTTAK